MILEPGWTPKTALAIKRILVNNGLIQMVNLLVNGILAQTDRRYVKYYVMPLSIEESNIQNHFCLLYLLFVIRFMSTKMGRSCQVKWLTDNTRR